jgi:hypothetical protein
MINLQLLDITTLRTLRRQLLYKQTNAWVAGGPPPVGNGGGQAPRPPGSATGPCHGKIPAENQ